MKRYTMPGLYAAFCLSWAGVITCVVLHEDVGGRWPWMLSVCAALLFTLLLLLVWLWRLGCGLYRWHPAVREVLFLLVAVMLCCWGFRGFTPSQAHPHACGENASGAPYSPFFDACP